MLGKTFFRNYSLFKLNCFLTMKHFNLLLLFVSSILAFVPTVKTTALDDEVEIELTEVKS